MIGPYDLSASLGIPGKFENLIFKNAIKKILSLAKKIIKKWEYIWLSLIC